MPCGIGGGGAVASRLLSAGLDGKITEWDLSTLRPRKDTDSHGGSVWAMVAEPAPNKNAPQRVAIACDDGCVRLLTLLDGDGVGTGLGHRRSFNRVQGWGLPDTFPDCSITVTRCARRHSPHLPPWPATRSEASIL
jgi:WD40 repeat protein